ncbi:MAG TPA: hypothetical protein VL334_21080 [Anaerolineae bacterium]|nr:hypothetical protein [Anaerolineae bacterium]
MSETSYASQFDLDALLEPVDWEHLRRMAALTPGQRMLAMAEVSAFQRGLLRGAFRRRYPDLPIEEINMLMFRYIEDLKARGL